jgi:hypothetical protein
MEVTALGYALAIALFFWMLVLLIVGLAKVVIGRYTVKEGGDE